MKKLYEVEVELTLYVMAESEGEAVDVAQSHADEEIDNVPSFNFSAIRPEHCLAGWKDIYPYGSDLDNTVGEILAYEKEVAKKQAEREYWEKKQIKMFAE